jgi:hypothetical protein
MLSQQARASIDRQGVHATDGGADGDAGILSVNQEVWNLNQFISQQFDDQIDRSCINEKKRHILGYS